MVDWEAAFGYQFSHWIFFFLDKILSFTVACECLRISSMCMNSIIN
uniref:Uncharacterized protein n=1 Tax=Rhizophora mucronata TaxID=61149 RepID=A0A2P2NVH6_RHIMU